MKHRHNRFKVFYAPASVALPGMWIVFDRQTNGVESATSLQNAFFVIDIILATEWLVTGIV